MCLAAQAIAKWNLYVLCYPGRKNHFVDQVMRLHKDTDLQKYIPADNVIFCQSPLGGEGKASITERNGISLHLDDRPDILEECARKGITSHQVTDYTRFQPSKNRAVCKHRNVLDAVKALNKQHQQQRQ